MQAVWMIAGHEAGQRATDGVNLSHFIHQLATWAVREVRPALL